MANNTSGIFPDLIKEPTLSENVKHLQKAQAFVGEISKTHDTHKIKIPGGVIVTTRPESWEEYEKVTLRGHALKR